MSVVVADDDPIVRASVCTVLGADGRFDVVAQADDGQGAVAVARRHRPDVALLDIRMASREDGLDAAEALRAQLPTTAVVLLTTFGEDAYVDRALRVGVAGFLLKSGDPAALTDGLAAAAAGGACLSPIVAARLIRHLAGGLGVRPVDRPAVLDSLTPRERDVLVAIARGLSNAEVAATLHLTEGTVKGYVSALFDRLGVRNRVEAAVLAHTAGLVPQG
ncbi:LuxR family transcriptional regulator [Oerskovia sp. Root918]|nr:LuxR family transcriptional regulator [Oerskovia sp. Root22]KRD36042.1 LuxR family transcriptional regulator [Oerskovia sp. Root918]